MMPNTMNAAAPALMPMMPGSASGLRVTPWRIAPLMPSAAPAKIPISVRGTRMSRMTVSDAEDGSKSVNAFQIVGTPTPREPSVMLKKHTSTRTQNSTISPAMSPAPERCRGAVSSRGAGVSSSVMSGRGRPSGSPP